MTDFDKSLVWLDELMAERQFFNTGFEPSLENINKALDFLKRPDQEFDWRVVIGGTAGKGTCVRSIERVLVEKGFRVVSLISPHIQVVTERIRINNELISKEFFGEVVLDIKKVCEEIDLKITYYEAIVLAGILAGKKSKAQVLICEVGCGGKFDAVNAVRGKRISGLTFIGEDHLSILGGTLEKVAETKAGIFGSDTVFGFSYEKKYCSIINNLSSVEIEYIKGLDKKLNKKISSKNFR